MPTHFRNCNLCEAMCGLEIEFQNHAVISIKGDEKDPFSRGHICPKAYGLKDIYEDKDRLKKPLLKNSDGTWKEISWDVALDLASSKIQEAQQKYGNNAVAIYQGNPSVHNLGTMLNSANLVKTLKTQNVYSATSTDQLPHHFASWLMFGHPLILPIVDIDHTDFMVIMGGNPLVSNGSMMTVPDVGKRLRAIQNRGGKVVVIDPRKTETAHKADQYLPIIPGADALLLIGFIHYILKYDLEKLENCKDYIKGFEELKIKFIDIDLDWIAKKTGIPLDNIIDIANQIITAKSASIYGRMGLSTQRFGGLCQWLINVLNIISDNFDKEGGVMFTKPIVDLIAKAKYGQRYNRWKSRVRQLPEIIGELPVVTLADEILTEGEGQIKCLITSCGNPVLSIPNGAKLETALENLDFYVAIDIYLNETTCKANLILPPATGLEVPHYDITFHTLAVRNTTKYSSPLFDKSEGAKYDWEIFQELCHKLQNNEGEYQPISPEIMLSHMLKDNAYGIDFETIKNAKHGIDLGPLKPCMPERLINPEKKVELMPKEMVDDLERLFSHFDKNLNNNNFTLIGRRQLRDNNSWMHNSASLIKGRERCNLLMHSTDAQLLNINDNELVNIKSRVNSVSAKVEISDDMMPGVVSLPHGYGHHRKGIQLELASAKAGVSLNDLTDHLLIDELTGNAAFSNLEVEIFKIS